MIKITAELISQLSGKAKSHSRKRLHHNFHKTYNEKVLRLLNAWHSIIALEEGTVMYEIKEGPFDENRRKMFAAWTPGEGTAEADNFNRKILT